MTNYIVYVNKMDSFEKALFDLQDHSFVEEHVYGKAIHQNGYLQGYLRAYKEMGKAPHYVEIGPEHPHFEGAGFSKLEVNELPINRGKYPVDLKEE